MVDVFDEVDEQIRSERFRALVRRGVPVFLGALALSVAVVLGVWGVGELKASASAKASEAYSRGTDDLQKNDLAGAYVQFSDSAKGPAGYKSLSLMQQAGIRLHQNNPAQAVALFDQAAKAAPDLMIGDAARLEAAYAVLDTASLADMTQRLTPLLPAGRPYRAQAREALALAKMAAGKTAEARSDLVVLGLMSDTPDSVRQRAGALVSVIDGGSAGSLKAMVKDSLAAPAITLPPDLGLQAPPAQTGN